MSHTSLTRLEQLEKIAQLLGMPSRSLATHGDGLAVLIELMAVWPRLSSEDQRDVVAFAVGRMARQAATAFVS